MTTIPAAAFLAILILTTNCFSKPPLPAGPVLLPGLHCGPWFAEQVCEQWIEGDVRAVIKVAGEFDPKRPTRLVVYATPNGNTIEQTFGCGPAAGLDWHFDIQHVAAQIRRLRESTPGENVVLACIEADGLSWPAWRKKHTDSAGRSRRVIDWLRGRLPGVEPRVTLTGHSGGGSFVFAFIDAAETIPKFVERIAFLDSNFSYSDAAGHGDKLLAWLRADAGRRLSVIAYDDRKMTLNGKLVVGPDGGTYRATQRMLARFGRDVTLNETQAGDFLNHSGLGGRIAVRVHSNPKNAILHTALVGEMNGLLQVLTEGEAKARAWGVFGGPRAYTKWVQPAPGIPCRPADASGGAAFMKSIAGLSRDDREEAIAAEISRGNIPEFLRRFRYVTVTAKDPSGRERTATVEVMPDYLAVGSDADFVRVAMSPLTAQRIADCFGCSLPTRKIADDIYRQAAVKLEPIPLTEAREAVETFIKHNDLIERQRAGKELGLLVAGVKKDVVVSNRLGEKPNRVALFGWHKMDGSPIQPLTIVHVNWYVDYSHGVRLVRRTVSLDGKPRDIRHVLHDAALCGLLSDEGPLMWPSY